MFTTKIHLTRSQSSRYECNRVSTPTSGTPIQADMNGPDFIEDWEYASVVGMSMYLAANKVRKQDMSFKVGEISYVSAVKSRNFVVYIS